jgi:hypothetical protein
MTISRKRASFFRFWLTALIVTAMPGLLLAGGFGGLDKLFAITTKGTQVVSDVTFSSTRGWLRHKNTKNAFLSDEALLFAETNYPDLRHDMAVGDGEYLRAFTFLLAERDDNRRQLQRLLNAEYAALFPAQAEEPDFVARLESLLQDHIAILN